MLSQDPAANARVLCRCSFLEIYNEAISDLLAPGAANLAVREDLRRGVYVEGLSEEVVSCGANLASPAPAASCHACALRITLSLNPTSGPMASTEALDSDCMWLAQQHDGKSGLFAVGEAAIMHATLHCQPRV